MVEEKAYHDVFMSVKDYILTSGKIVPITSLGLGTVSYVISDYH